MHHRRTSHLVDAGGWQHGPGEFERLYILESLISTLTHHLIRFREDQSTA